MKKWLLPKEKPPRVEPEALAKKCGSWNTNTARFEFIMKLM